MIKQEIPLDELDVYKVSVETKQFVDVDGVLYQIGTPHRRAYSNSSQDRILYFRGVSRTLFISNYGSLG